MPDLKERVFENQPHPGIDRRTFLKIAGVTGGIMASPGFLLNNLFAAESADYKIELEDEAYLKFYNGKKGWYMQDDRWIKQVVPRLTWPEEGEQVPEIDFPAPSNATTWIDGLRKWTKDAEQIGLKYKIRTMSQSRWLTEHTFHRHEDIELHPAVLRVERLDPAEWLTSRAYGKERRNYGEWVNKEYDRLIELQAAESDPVKRRELVYEAQKVIADDYYIQQFGWGPSIVQAYNSRDWEGVVQSKAFGIASSNLFWTFINAKPKTDRKRIIVGQTALLQSTNIFQGTNMFRAIGRMIYDRLAYLDKDLNIIPWAAESWERLDNRTWNVKLRDGMQFHDGKPVTVEDLKFTFDFMMKYDRGLFWTFNQWLEGVEITDRGKRTVRFRFKRPYGQFESSFLIFSIILPKHEFEGIMEKQGVGKNPRKLKIPAPMGSGPFKWGSYKKDAELLLVANKDHFHAPNIDELLYVVVPSVDGILGRLETGEIDFGGNLSPSQAKQLSNIKHLSIVRTPDINWYHGVPRVSVLPWRDIEFRRAWHHSIDREFMVNVVWEGEGRVPTANTFLVDNNPWHNPKLPPIPEFDLQKARKILQNAGYRWDKDGRLLYPPPSDKAFVERVTRVCKPGYTWGGLKMLPRN